MPPGVWQTAAFRRTPSWTTRTSTVTTWTWCGTDSTGCTLSSCGRCGPGCSGAPSTHCRSEYWLSTNQLPSTTQRTDRRCSAECWMILGPGYGTGKVDWTADKVSCLPFHSCNWIGAVLALYSFRSRKQRVFFKCFHVVHCWPRVSHWKPPVCRHWPRIKEWMDIVELKRNCVWNERNCVNNVCMLCNLIFSTDFVCKWVTPLTIWINK